MSTVLPDEATYTVESVSIRSWSGCATEFYIFKHVTQRIHFCCLFLIVYWHNATIQQHGMNTPACCTRYRIPEEDYLLDAQRLEDSIGSLVMIRAGVRSLESTFFRLHVVPATKKRHL